MTPSIGIILHCTKMNKLKGKYFNGDSYAKEQSNEITIVKPSQLFHRFQLVNNCLLIEMLSLVTKSR